MGLEAPFVGRDEELRLLREQLHAAERERKLRVVAVTGQAGMGKSRLAWELEKYLDGLAGPQLYYWHQGRSPSYGEGVTYWALGEMVRRRARIAEGEDPDETREKLRATLDEFVPDPDERRWLEPALGALLGVQEPDWDQREQLFSAWRTFLERVADKGPSVFVFEDLQWADTGMLDFLDHMLDWSRDRPMLIVTLARPEFLERRPNFGRGHRAFSSLHLEPLSEAAMTELLRGLAPGLAADDVARIVARAEGLPLYTIETVRALVDSGHLVRNGDIYEATGDLPVLDIPPTLRALIASRLDAIDPADRTLLQDGAIIGQVFSVPALAAIGGRLDSDVDERLRAMAVKELVALENDPRSPERGQYQFTQGLIREIAYATLSKRERRAKHIAAARYFEQLGDEELAGVLANHYLEAYEAAPEGEEGAAVAAQARVALRAAAERAARLHSHEQALAYLEQALAVTFDEQDRIDVSLQAGGSATSIGRLDRAEEHYRAALEWQESSGDKVQAAAVAALLGRMLLYASKIDESMAVLKRALPDVEPDSRESVDLYGELARAHMFRDEPEEAIVAVERALEAAEAKSLRASTIQLLITKSWALITLRRSREATALLLGSMRMANEEGFLGAELRALFNLTGYVGTDDPKRAIRLGMEGIAKARQFGLALNATNMAGNVASCALVTGDLELVLELERSVEDLDAPMSLSVRGYAAVARSFMGDEAGARERLVQVERVAEGTTSAQDLSQVAFLQAGVELGAGRLEDALVRARVSRDAYFGSDGPFAAVFAGRLSLLLRDLDGAMADQTALENHAIFGAWVQRGGREISAGVLALAGRTAESLVAFRQVIDEWDRAELPFDRALALFERAHLLGDRDAEAAAGREEAARVFAAAGAEGLIERLEAGVPAIPRPIASPSGSPAESSIAR